jgi:hypothetical protein
MEYILLQSVGDQLAGEVLKFTAFDKVKKEDRDVLVEKVTLNLLKNGAIKPKADYDAEKKLETEILAESGTKIKKA